MDRMRKNMKHHKQLTQLEIREELLAINEQEAEKESWFMFN